MAHFPRTLPLPEPLWNISLLPTPNLRRAVASAPRDAGAGALKAPAVLSLREGEAQVPTARAA